MSPRKSSYLGNGDYSVHALAERNRLYGKPLTAEEKKVLQLICWGYSITEIADELEIPDRRAKYRVDTIRYKTGNARKRDLILWAKVNEKKLSASRPTG